MYRAGSAFAQHVGGRRQVLLHEDRRDEQGRGVVVESGAAAAVGGEGIGRVGVDAEQVADRVVVLPPGQPLDQAGAGIADALDRVEDGPDRGRRALAIVLVGTGPVARRRHGPLDQGIDDPEPQIGIAAERLLVRELRQVDVALGLLAAVATQAMLLEERPDVPVEAVTPRGAGSRTVRRQQHQGRDRGPPGTRGSGHGGTPDRGRARVKAVSAGKERATLHPHLISAISESPQSRGPPGHA